MPIRVQFGNAKRGPNAYSVSQHGECVILQVGAFRETYGLAHLFYNSILEHLRSAVSGMWVVVQSRKSLGGGRKRDLKLAGREPVAATEDYLVFDLRSKADLDATFEVFWPRKAIRFYGWQDLPHAQRLRSISMLYRQERLEDFDRFIPELLRFCAEKDSWEGFLRILSHKSEMDLLNAAIHHASGLLNEPLIMERSIFDSA